MEQNFEANFFTLLELLDATGRLEIEAACTKVTMPANQVVYEQDAPANAVYIVVSGMAEAFTHSPDKRKTRSVGFMGKGNFFGDLAVLTGFPRLASVRTCEETKLLQIEKIAFQRLLEKVPKLGAYFSRNLAFRLHQTSTVAFLNVYSMDLTGNLQHFDLLTIFQAITGTGRHGELQLHNASNEVIGSFFFRQGRAEHARFVHLSGIEAVWEGFLQSATDGTFTFRVMPEPTAQFNDETRLTVDSMDLLMQGATKRDGFHALPYAARDMEGKLARIGETLTWTDPDTKPLAERIWELIAKRPQPLDSLWRRVNYSTFTFLETVHALVDSGQARIEED